MLRLSDVSLNQGAFSMQANLAVPKGQMVAIIGPSGGGKSTLLSAVAGFLRPSRGTIIWDERDMTDLPPAQRPVSILFQDNNLFPHLTIAQNVGLGLKPALRLSPDDDTRVGAVLSQVGLQGLADRKPAALSGGQQSRAALARVLLGNRPLVLMDEPFAALGPGLKAEMLALVRTTLIAAGKTVLMVTHDPQDAKDAADVAILVTDQRAHPPVAVDQLFADPPPALRAYLGKS